MNQPQPQSNPANFLIVILGGFILLAAGMFGYIYLEGWSWDEALYMTLITLSTVGFSEVRPMDPAGRIFTSFIIIGGLILIAMLSASVTSLLVRRQFIYKFRSKKMKDQIHRQRDHVILCGAGDTGKTVINEFQNAGKTMVIIEQAENEIIALQAQFPQMMFIKGDATKDDILLDAGIEHASGLITALSVDTDNLFIVLSARTLNSKLNIVSRSVDQHAASKMYKAGANHVISPNLTEGMRMAATILRPNIVGFLDVMMHDQEMLLRLEEVALPEGSKFENQILRDMQIPQKTGLMVIAVKTTEKGVAKYKYNPYSETLIKRGDVLIVLGDKARVEKLIEHLAGNQ